MSREIEDRRDMSRQKREVRKPVRRSRNQRTRRIKSIKQFIKKRDAMKYSFV